MNMTDRPSSPDELPPLILERFEVEKIRVKTRRQYFPAEMAGKIALSPGVEKLAARRNSRDLSRADVPSDCSLERYA